MKKRKNLLLFSTLMLLLGILVVLLVFYWDRSPRQNRLTDILLLYLPMVVVCGCGFLILKKRKIVTKLLIAGNVLALCLLLGFGCFYSLATNHPYSGQFSIETTLFDNQNVLIVVPHQDDDVNLMGGLIEQYARANSNISVVFTTNGDGDLANADIRAAEAVEALAAMGVEKENIYYLGFGDIWTPQETDGKERDYTRDDSFHRSTCRGQCTDIGSASCAIPKSKHGYSYRTNCRETNSPYKTTHMVGDYRNTLSKPFGYGTMLIRNNCSIQSDTDS